MEAKTNHYEAVGRIFYQIAALHSEAERCDLYLAGGLDHDGEFYLTVYDKSIEERYYSTPVHIVCDDKIDAICAEVNAVRGFIRGFAKAREIAAKAAKQPEVEFGPLEEVKPKEQEAE